MKLIRKCSTHEVPQKHLRLERPWSSSEGVQHASTSPTRPSLETALKSNLHPSIYDCLHPLNLKASLMWLTRTIFCLVVYIMFFNSERRLGPGRKSNVTYSPNALTYLGIKYHNHPIIHQLGFTPFWHDFIQNPSSNHGW